MAASKQLAASAATTRIRCDGNAPVSYELARRPLKTAEAMALEIVRDIVARRLQPGDRLPQESDMMAQYRISRASLREAVRLLEVQGLIAIRRGAGNGMTVGQVLPGNIARMLALYLHMQGTEYAALLDAWIETEPMLARLAALNSDRLKVVTALTPYLNEHHRWAVREGMRFHDIVAELAASPVLTLIVRSIGFIVTEQVLTSAERNELESNIVHDHREVAEAIIAGKGDAAAERMREHIVNLVEDFKIYWPLKVGEKIQWR